jgi:hypothetical protein
MRRKIYVESPKLCNLKNISCKWYQKVQTNEQVCMALRARAIKQKVDEKVYYEQIMQLTTCL